MNTKNLFITEAFVCLLFGVALTFMPDYIGNQYLTDPSWINPATKTVGQGFGTVLIAIAIACWYGRKAGPSLSRQALLLLLLLNNVAQIIIHPLAIINHVETPAAWVSFLISIGIAGWAGMFLRQGNSELA